MRIKPCIDEVITPVPLPPKETISEIPIPEVEIPEKEELQKQPLECKAIVKRPFTQAQMEERENASELMSFWVLCSIVFARLI